MSKLGHQRLDILKLDIEGMEFQVRAPRSLPLDQKMSSDPEQSLSVKVIDQLLDPSIRVEQVVIRNQNIPSIAAALNRAVLAN